MSSFATSHTHGSTLGSALRVARSVAITVPAGKSARATELAKARKIYGFDLSDDQRAAKVRLKRAR